MILRAACIAAKQLKWKLGRILGIFVHCILDRYLGDTTANVAKKGFAVTRLRYLLIGAQQHHRLADKTQKFGHIFVDARRIKQNNARSRRTFSQRNHRRSTPERMPDQNDLAGIDTAVDSVGLPVNKFDDTRQQLAVFVPRPFVGQLQRQRVHPPRRHVQCLIRVIFFGVFIAMQNNHQRCLACGRCQVQIRRNGRCHREVDIKTLAHVHRKWAAIPELLHIGLVSEQIPLQLGHTRRFKRGYAGTRQSGAAANQQ